MKAKHLLILPALFVGGFLPAQTTNAPAAPLPHVVDVPQPDQPSPEAAAAASGENVDAAKVADYQRRFKEGNDLEAAGKLPEAMAIYQGILAEEPNAKGSLLHAGEISFVLGDLAKANDYFQKLHDMVPDFPEAIGKLIQINQELKRDVKVELLIRELNELHASGRIPSYSQSICFVREEIPSDKDDIIISQFFDFTKAPYTVWMAEVYDANSKLKRRLLLNYDPDATKALQAKDAKYAGTQVFTWFEHILKDGQVTQIDAYLQIFALPDYQKFRSAMFVILADPPKPIYSAPVNAATQ